MADEQHELRRVNWNEVFAFTHIFKSFRMAIHPSKILLMLAAIVVIYVGGRVMDGVWRTGGRYVMMNEIQTYADSRGGQFDAVKSAWEESRPARAAQMMADSANQAHYLTAYTATMPSGRLAAVFAEELAKANADMEKGEPYKLKTAEQYRSDAEKDWRDVLGEAANQFGRETDRIDALLSKAKNRAKDAIGSLSRDEEDKAARQLKADYAKSRQTLAARKRQFAEADAMIRGKGIFVSVLDYEHECLGRAISAVWRGDISGGLDVYATGAAASVGRPMGFLYHVLMAIQGVAWLFTEHWVFAIVLLVLALGAWAVFGGAVHRIAALHAAREEKISAVQALKFSIGKFISFFTAPLIPLAIILVLGLLLALGGLLVNLWGVGAIVVALLLFAAILLGLLIAFLLVGLGGGLALMFPTVAVEGSDSFDAISRSFSYVFARPWRALLYGLVALFHGSICYLFVRLFVFLALAATHYFINWGVFTGGESLSAAASRLDVLWSAPTFHDLHGQWNWAAMSGSEKIAAWVMGVWVYLVAASVVAFALSYAASATTVIYYLLRRKVDATDLDDVYVEEAPADQDLPASEAAPAEPADEADTSDENKEEEST